MIIAGAICIVIGVVLFFVSQNSKKKLEEMKLTKTSTAAEIHELQQSIAGEIGPGGVRQQTELKGNARCTSPLKAELSGMECIHYSMTVEERYEEDYEERDSQGHVQRRTRTGSNVVASNTQSARFALDDGTGSIDIDPAGASIDARQVVDKYEPATGPLSSLRFGGFSLQLGAMLTGGRRVLGYHYRESVIAVGDRIYALGEISDADGTPVMRRPAEKGHPYIISTKSEEELQKGAESTSAFTLYGAIALLIVGVVLLVLGAAR